MHCVHRHERMQVLVEVLETLHWHTEKIANQLASNVEKCSAVITYKPTLDIVKKWPLHCDTVYSICSRNVLPGLPISLIITYANHQGWKKKIERVKKLRKKNRSPAGY